MKAPEIEVNCSLKLLREVANEGWIKQLAFFHLLKCSFGNSVIFDYKSRMPILANQFGVSTKTFYNYINLLKVQNLVYVFSGNENNLSLRSIKGIKNDYSDQRKTKIIITANDSLWDIECRLFAKLIEYHIKKMAFMEAIRRFESRNILKIRSNGGGFLPSFSIRNIAKLLNINKSKAEKLIKTLIALRIIEVIESKSKKISKHKLPIGFVSDYPGYLYTTEKGTFQMFGNQIILKDYPVCLPKMNLNRYVKYYKSTHCKIIDNL